MLTSHRIEALRETNGASASDAAQALSAAAGKVQHAIGDLNNPALSGKRAIVATTRESAQRIAAALVNAGVWFECELTAIAQWRFCVAPGAYPKLIALSNATASGEAVAATM